MKWFHLAAALFSALLTPSLTAGSATWAINPTTGDWNTVANWMPNTVPNSTSDIATFGPSNVTALSITNTNIDLDSAVFNNGAPPYTINVVDRQLTLTGAGIENNSGVMQSFVLSNNATIYFYNTASAGEMTSVSGGGGINLYDSASAGSATFNVTHTDGTNTYMDFGYGATAEDATINASGGAYLIFYDASGGNATFNLTTNSYLQFGGASNAEHANVNLTGAYGVLVLGTSSAGDATFTVNPANTTTQTANTIYFADSATAGNATFILEGSMGPGLLSSSLLFYDTSTAANANITVNGGVNGSAGSVVFFGESSEGGKASITLNGNGKLNLGHHNGPVTIGSLSGDGVAVLAGNSLTIGSNNQSTTFSGVIKDTGSVIKSGTGTLTLSGASTYIGDTSVSGGVLNAGNESGSATSTGAVNVNAGTLGGRGIIAGPTTVGTGSGAGAFLAPAVGSNKQTTLTLQNALTLNADATYSYTFKAKRNKTRIDLVKANGVTINGAAIDLVGQTQGSLNLGLTFTVISNTSANPIIGSFSNLPDGASVNVNGNHLQASYTGGDGNDLTLTVVP